MLLLRLVKNFTLPFLISKISFYLCWFQGYQSFDFTCVVLTGTWTRPASCVTVSYSGCPPGSCPKHSTTWSLLCVPTPQTSSGGVCSWSRGMTTNVVSVRSGTITDKETSGLKICSSQSIEALSHIFWWIVLYLWILQMEISWSHTFCPIPRPGWLWRMTTSHWHARLSVQRTRGQCSSGRETMWYVYNLW